MINPFATSPQELLLWPVENRSKPLVCGLAGRKGPGLLE